MMTSWEVVIYKELKKVNENLEKLIEIFKNKENDNIL